MSSELSMWCKRYLKDIGREVDRELTFPSVYCNMILPCSVALAFRAVQKLTVFARRHYKEDLIFRGERSAIETPRTFFFSLILFLYCLISRSHCANFFRICYNFNLLLIKLQSNFVSMRDFSLWLHILQRKFNVNKKKLYLLSFCYDLKFRN